MKQSIQLKHKFVEYVPDRLEDNTLYVSMEYSTVVHKCCCGCGSEVVTPISPTDWKIIFNGQSISLDPSIGNWSFPCQSHYWITLSKVRWAEAWTKRDVELGRNTDLIKKTQYFDNETTRPQRAVEEVKKDSSNGFKNRVMNWLRKS